MTASSSLISHSQSGQDTWVHSLIGDKGTFLDIGAGDPIKFSNTYALEQLGWRGFLVEQDRSKAIALYEKRLSSILQCDATKLLWENFKDFGKNIDYLSLDLDSSSLCLDVIAKLTLTDWRFRCMTIEHEAYKEGTEGRDALRFFLLRHGYKLAKADVLCEGLEKFPYEDWWTCAG